MRSGRATESRTGEGRDRPGGGGTLVLFPEPRSFGPLSWRAVRIASLTFLLLILLGALVELFVGPCLRNDAARTPGVPEGRL